MTRAAALFLASALLSGSTLAATGKLSVVTTLFPLVDWSRQIGGEHVEVATILPAGAQAHGFAPRPADMLRIRNADVFLWAGKAMEPWAADLLAGADRMRCLAVDASRELEAPPDEHDHAASHRPPAAANGLRGFFSRIAHALPGRAREDDACAHGDHAHGDSDPHLWLDPVLARGMVHTIAEGFAERDPAHAGFYRANAQAYARRLDELDADIRAALSTRRLDTIIHAGHFAFGRFAERYELEHITPYRGFSADAAPTPRAVRNLIARMRELDARVIFHEQTVDPKIARVLAEETGAILTPLHTLHNLTTEERRQGVTYLELMRRNLENLKLGLDCAP